MSLECPSTRRRCDGGCSGARGARRAIGRLGKLPDEIARCGNLCVVRSRSADTGQISEDVGVEPDPDNPYRSSRDQSPAWRIGKPPMKSSSASIARLSCARPTGNTRATGRPRDITVKLSLSVTSRKSSEKRWFASLALIARSMFGIVGETSAASEICGGAGGKSLNKTTNLNYMHAVIDCRSRFNPVPATIDIGIRADLDRRPILSNIANPGADLQPI